jgi:hypothetical protein
MGVTGNDGGGDQWRVGEVKEAREKCGEALEPGEGGGCPLGEIKITGEVGWQGNVEGGREWRSLGGWGIRDGWGYEESKNGNTQG